MFKSITCQLKNWKSWDEKRFFLSFGVVPVSILMPMLIALIPKFIIDLVEFDCTVDRIIIIISMISIVLVFVNWIEPYLREITNASSDFIRDKYRILALEKLLKTNYANLENYKWRTLFESATEFYYSKEKQPCSSRFLSVFINIIISALGITTYIFVFADLSFLLIVLVVLTTVLEGWLSYISVVKHIGCEKDTISLNMQLKYLYRLSASLKHGKDIRIFNLKQLFNKKIFHNMFEYKNILKNYIKLEYSLSFFRLVLSAFRELVVYIVLIYLVSNEEKSLSDFVFYFGIMQGFSKWIDDVTGLVVELKKICAKFNLYQEIINSDETLTEQFYLTQKVNEIVFKNVWYSYSDDENYVVKDLNFTIQEGENIAIVGENGAGKSTLIKLLCGLYKPQKGEIYINGVNINSVELSKLQELFSPVFQDYNLLPMTIAQNISLVFDNADTDKIDWIVKKVGLEKVINKLPNGINAHLGKEICKDGVELSGGEIQKLLLARAVYKDAPIVILDEPTASLDAIAERELYLEYNSLMGNKTTFFVSHRLASAKFCDKIIFLENGKIKEIGTHSDLVKLKGEYWKMFSAQSKFYNIEEII